MYKSKEHRGLGAVELGTRGQQRWAVRLHLAQYSKRSAVELVLTLKPNCSHHSSQTCALLTASWRDFPSAVGC